MAYDSLKALIRQYIKTNGEQEITGQILQNVLVEMVNQYPSTDGYATQSWVTSQGYATTSQLAGYLPLTGGNLDGNLSIYDTMNIYSSSIEWNDDGDYSRIAFDDDGITVTAHGTGYVIANEFIKNGGTSSQFLKADGSVDSNTYITSASLSGYATQSWVNTQLANYLPLTGGNIDGNLSIYDTMNIYSSSIEWNDDGDYSRIAFDDDGITVTAHGTGYVIANEFVKSGGTSSQFLKADGSVDSNAYITLASVKGNLSVWNNTAMTWGTLTAANGYTIGVHASSSDGGDWGMCYKSGQISMQLDGWYYQNEGRYRVVDTSDLASYNPTTNFKTINNQSIIGTGNINIEGGGGGTLYDAEIEYIESTGTQWIDTGYKFASDNIQIESKFQKTGGTFFTIGDYGTNDGNRFEILRENAALKVLCNPYNLEISANANEVNILTVNYNNGTLSSVYNNETKSVTGLNSIKTNAQNILIGKRPSGSPDVGIGQYKIWYLRIFDGGSLVRDFIPVRVGNVGYLYDKVSGQLFGNSGTGDFVLGQDTGPGGGLPYLPLTGGTITGNLTVNGAVKFNSNLTFAYDRGIYFGTDNGIRIKRDNSRLLIVDESSDDIIIGDYDNRNYTSIVNDLQGCTTNSSAYILATQTWYILNDGTAQFKTISQTSDLRKKTIMGDVPMNPYNVANAPLFKFTWKDEKKYSGQHIGSAAQYWQTILPELVIQGSDADMTLAMQYDVIALASAITVAKTVVNHEERIILLERENEALKKEIANLKSA